MNLIKINLPDLEFGTYFSVVTCIQSLTIYSDQLTFFKCLSHIIYQVCVYTIFCCMTQERLDYNFSCQQKMKHFFVFYNINQLKHIAVNGLPSLHIGISFRPFLRIAPASSSVRPSGAL